ncbi:MAG: DNA polymerase III subunit gamma/tau [Verrucomicrobia bacterium]|nr:DNA polymerase III subunit gamma/tau [Verrucomicrobiota bacterium]
MQTQSQTYQVIPRKFRPQTFETVVGQEAIVTTLKNALRFNRLAHAYLFCGCRGTGKTTLARVFAKALNCQSLTPDLEPCNTCPSCTEIMSGRSLDVLEIDGASNRGIDDIRQINETIGYAPASGKFKIYIIDEVHMLTKEAFNALLKTLEEPPSNVKFFFATTEPHKVLPTIISRCQRFDLNRIAQGAMVEKLAYIAKDLGVQCHEEALSLIAYLSEGSLRDAESLMDQVICYAEQPISAEGVSNTLGLMPKESFFALDKAIAEHQCSFAFDLSQTLFSSGKDLSYFLDHLLEHFRTLLQIKFHKPCFFLNSAHQEHYTQAAAFYSEEQCLYILDYLIQWQQQISKSPFKRIGLEMILLHLIRSKHRVTFGTLVKQLSEIQAQMGQSSFSPNQSPAQQPVSSASPVQKNELKQPQAMQPAVPAKQQASSADQVETALTKAPADPAPCEPKQPQEAVAKLLSPEKMSFATTSQAMEPAAAPIAVPLPKKETPPLPDARANLAPSIEEILLNKVKSQLDRAQEDAPNADAVEVQENQDKPAPAEKIPSQSAKAEEKEQIKVRQEAQNLLDRAQATDETAKGSTSKPQEKAAAHNAQSRYETLIRFASVELEGVIK